VTFKALVHDKSIRFSSKVPLFKICIVRLYSNNTFIVND